jgi:PucR-like helix-turn-helix protein/diguanylate cyclase with GGDEF domain
MRIEEVRVEIADRLRARKPEIEQAVLARVHAVANSDQVSNPEYAEGLRATVSAALGYGIEALDRSPGDPPPMPAIILTQARLAARHGVQLATVLRRYLAGHTLLGDFLLEESEREGSVDGASLKRFLRIQSALLDDLLASVSDEYGREKNARPVTAKQRRAQRVERLLAGELVDTADIDYDFGAWHLALVACGQGAAGQVSVLTESLGLRRLVIEREDAVWLWLGSRQPIDAGVLVERWPENAALAVGEPAEGIAGWRLTHQQAQAVLPVARARGEGITRYTDDALLASTLQDDLLATSLRRLYLDPLSVEKDGGAVSRETLRAYFAAQQNVTSAAAALGVNRNTVASRLRQIEDRIGRPLGSCGSELLAALRLDDLSGGTE